MIRQGDVYWLELEQPRGSEPGYRHPHVVIQCNVFNQSKINTVALCALTSNLKRASSPGNVLLKKGEANLSKPSVVNISQLITVDRADLGDKIGSLSQKSLDKIIAGIKILIEPKDIF